MAVTTVPVLTAHAATASAAPAGVSGTVAMGGGATASITEQTGVLATAFPLVSLPGRGAAGVELTLAYDQTAAGAGADRHGMGQGIGLGKAFINPDDGGTLHTAGGGSYPLRPGDTKGTGVQRYLLKDLALRDARGALPEREGLEGVPRDYRWVLTYDDGRKNYFSAEGDLIAEQDPHGHETAYAWEVQNGQHRLERAVDAWGQAVTFDYSREDRVTVTSPVRSDGKQPVITLHLADGRLTSVAYPEDQTIQLAWDYTPEGQPGRLLTRIEAPAGAVTRIGYDQPHGFPIASSLKVTDREGKDLTPERTFRLGTEGEHAGHDFTGRGQYDSADALFDSADADYRYVTELSDGQSTVRSVYNSLHLLKERTTTLNVQGEQKPVRTQNLAYEGEREDGQAPPPASALPANYGKPVRAEVTVHDPATGKSRTTTETARFDEHGRETERTDVTGAKTVTQYDPTALDAQEGGGSEGSDGPQEEPAGFGLPVRITVTGHDGAEAVTENTLTDDRKSIASTRQLVKNKGEKDPSARTTTAFQINGQGEVTGKTVTWADGVKPDGVQGPDEISATYKSVADTAGHTRTDTVQNAAGVSSQVTDLVTGQVIRVTDTEGRTTETGYDQAGRVITQKVPGGPKGDGLIATTAYTPQSTTVTAPGKDGKQHVTVEHRDLLGRVVKQTDNISGGALTGDPAARTLQSVVFEDGGRTARVTDAAGRTTLATSDEMGRPVKTVAPNGMTQLTVYADAATADTSTVTTLTLPAGETDPARAVVTATETSDHADRPVASGTTFADGTMQTGSTQAYDSLGRTAEAVSQDVATTPSYGPAGTPAVTTLTPQNTDVFPGQKITASSPQDLTGAPVVKTLTPGQDAEAGRSGTSLARDAAGRVTEERHPDGRKTVFEYTAEGQVAKAVSPSGVTTSYRYDETTGQVLEVTVTSADGRTTQKTGYTYDPHTRAVTSVFNPEDTDGSRISYTYDADGNTTSVTYPDGRTLSQTFSEAGQLKTATDITGATTLYTYNGDGTLATAVQHAKDSPGTVLAQVSYRYDGLGRTTNVIRGNPEDAGKTVTTRYTHTGAGQISSEKTTGPGGTLLTGADYSYDSHGNLAQRTDTRPESGADGAPGKPATTTTRYTYDAYNRLTGSDTRNGDAKREGDALSSTRYTLNVSGDVVKTETTPHTGDQAGKTQVTEHTVDAGGQLTAVTAGSGRHEQTFDSEGNLLTGHAGTAYTYNTLDQPLTVTGPDGNTTHYTYWADGTRRSATTGEDGTQKTTVFHYSPAGTLTNDTHTTTGTGTDGRDSANSEGQGTTASYLHAATRAARTLSGTDAAEASATGAGYLLTDRHGSTTALASDSGEVRAAWNYTDYGQHTTAPGTPAPAAAGTPARSGAAANPFTYAGEYTNPETGTQYLRARLYDPATARFTQRDPADLHNKFQAFNANPITYTDPTGHTAELDWAVSGTMLGVTILAAAVSLVLAAPTGGGSWAFFAIALAGAALDTASAAVSTAAMATGKNQWDSPLNIASYVLGGLGLVTGAIGAGAQLGHKARLAAEAGGAAAEAAADLSPYGKTAVELHEMGTGREAGLTSAMRNIQKTNGGKLAGLQHRVKTVKSINEKLIRGQLPANAREAADSINDLNRYTVVLESDEYVQKTKAWTDELAGQFEYVSNMNFWELDHYKGFNTTWKAKDGKLFEVQFQTPESHSAGKLTHPYYEKMRNPDTPHPEYNEMYTKSAEIFRTVRAPASAKHTAALLTAR
ncbi:RHS repeat-associated core domain-containing protein [Streptomyces sp. NPDC008121]|uniref:RHS repeat domain-containing protein n=1 Tax=Streptomyces sp. NPDC008121 TaxID=3364809 RepID=UPI0036E9C8E1